MKRFSLKLLLPLGLGLLVVSCASPGRVPGGHDVVIQHGTIYDGSGGTPFVGTVAIRGDRISYLGPPAELRTRTVIDATGSFADGWLMTAAIVAGGGTIIAGASKELLEVAELLQAPVMTTMPGKKIGRAHV